MILAILCHAVIITVTDISTLTDCIQNSSIVAPFACSNEHVSLGKFESKLRLTALSVFNNDMLLLGEVHLIDS
jgi:hypothetical protein